MGMNGEPEMSEKQISQSFIARIWLERGSTEKAFWRGHVRHVQGEEETYFKNLEAMNSFLERVSGVAGPGRNGSAQEHDGDTGPGADENGA